MRPLPSPVVPADPLEPTRVLLARHGQSAWNAEGRWQGHADPPLSPLGVRQAESAAATVGQVAAVITSDLQRARATAELIAEQIGADPVLVDARLRERDAGEWTGLTRAEIEREWPGYLDAGRRPPGFELDEAILGRVLDAMADLHAAHPGERVLAVAHGGVIRALERQFGVDDGLVPNLGGRIVDVHQHWLTAGDRFVLVGHDELTAPQQL
jgi:probable phosphoglycerate mutase